MFCLLQVISQEDIMKAIVGTLLALALLIVSLPFALTQPAIAWQYIEPVFQLLDEYNNGLLCAPHRA
jgi:hypothetical protein